MTTIVPDCINVIYESLRKQGLHKSLNFCDSDWLVQKIDKYLPDYWEDRDKDDIFKEQQTQIVKLSQKNEKTVRGNEQY